MVRRQLGRRRTQGYQVGLVMMGLFYVMAGVNHLVMPQVYLAVMPPYIPWAGTMVLASGVAEILGGIGVLMPDRLLFPSVRKFAAWGIVLMLAAFLPVHIYMVLHPEAFPRIPVWGLWVRLPLQLPLMVWAWWYTRD